MKAPKLMLMVAMFATAMLVLPASVKAQREPGEALAVGASATATVKAIDPAARTVTLETADGETRTIKCGEEVRNFDKVKVGDKVKAVAIEAMVIAVGKGGSPDACDDATITRAPKGDKPGVIIARSEEITAKVDNVDAATRTVTLTGPGGQTKPIKVSADVDLAALSKGDEVTLRVSKGVALWVQSPQEAAQAAGMSAQGALAAETVGLELESKTATATVEAIDPAKRMITLKGASGQTKQISLGKEAINFDQIKVGDKVRATLAEEVVVAVSKGGPPPSGGEGIVMARAAEGGKPGILIAESVQVTGKIQSIDAAKREMTLAEAGGKPRTIHVGQKVNLSDLKAGDDITARVTQAVAIVVEKP